MPGRVHVVDDDDSFRTAMERRLKLAGYEVATYPSAQQLLDRLPDEDEPGCILLDLRMPRGRKEVDCSDLVQSAAKAGECAGSRWGFV